MSRFSVMSPFPKSDYGVDSETPLVSVALFLIEYQNMQIKCGVVKPGIGVGNRY